MLDMGFEPQIQRIVRTLPRQRQTLFFSATWPREVRQIASQFVVNQTVHVFIGGVEEKLVANKSITQHVSVLNSSHEKFGELSRIIRSKPAGTRIIIFCTTKRMCDQLSYQMGRDFRSAAIHGDKKQSERDYVLQVGGLLLGRLLCLIAHATTGVRHRHLVPAHDCSRVTAGRCTGIVVTQPQNLLVMQHP